MVICVSYLLTCSFSLRHSSYSDLYRILSKVPQDNAGYACSFITKNTSGIPPSKANPTGRTFPPLFTINRPEEDQIIEDLEDIEGMQTTMQVI